MTPPPRLPPGATDNLDGPEGTVEMEFLLTPPLGHPPVAGVLMEDETPAKTLVRLEVDDDLRFSFVRQAPGGDPVVASVDATPLHGARRLVVQCTWSPLGMDIHVFDVDDPNASRMVTSESEK